MQNHVSPGGGESEDFTMHTWASHSLSKIQIPPLGKSRVSQSTQSRITMMNSPWNVGCSGVLVQSRGAGSHFPTSIHYTISILHTTHNCSTQSLLSSVLPPNALPSTYDGPPAFSPWQTLLILEYLLQVISFLYFCQVIMLASILDYELCEAGEGR